MKTYKVLVITTAIILSFGRTCFSIPNNSQSSSSQNKVILTPFSEDEHTQNIIRQHELENQGYLLARDGLFDQALQKYKASMDTSLFKERWNKGMGTSYIQTIYKRQQKYEQSLQIIEKRLRLIPGDKRIDVKNIFTAEDNLQREKLELQALIKARDTQDNKPIYDYIRNLKSTSKYSLLLPSKGYAVGITLLLINDLIHLYDYLHNYNAGIAFMDEIIKYHTQHKDKNHRSAHAKDVREYIRVKQAWKLDKKTGKHGHLQDVIKTSDIISW